MIATGYQKQIDRKRAMATKRIARFGLRCRILRPATTLNAAGVPVAEPVEVATNVPCWVIEPDLPRRDREEVTAGEVQSIAPLVVIVPWDTDARETDLIEVDGRTLYVTGGAGGIPGRTLLRLEVVEVNP